MADSSKYDDIINKWAQYYKVDPALIKGHIAVESNFVASAIAKEPNNTTSYGLMQLNDVVLQGYPQFANPADRIKALDPDTNIKIGASLIAYHQKRFPDDLNKRIASYNSGSPILNSSGNLVNQSYVDKVKKFYEFFKSNAKHIAMSSLIFFGAVGLGVFFLIKFFSKKGKEGINNEAQKQG